jgi:hypothetical protein
MSTESSGPVFKTENEGDGALKASRRESTRVAPGRGPRGQVFVRGVASEPEAQRRGNPGYIDRARVCVPEGRCDQTARRNPRAIALQTISE